MSMNLILKIKFAFISLLLGTTLSAGEISELVLANGLKIIVKPDHRSSIVVFQIWYKVGSAYETPGITGISHLLEHLMYKGIKSDPSGKLFKAMNRIGAKGNAFTSRDFSYYFHQLEKTHLALAFELEAERMQNLLFRPEVIELEKRVIEQEQKTRLAEDPYLSAYDNLYQLAYGNTGYGLPVIGLGNDVRNLSLNQINSWYQQYYQPSNATVVISGDILPQKAFKLAKQYFSVLPNQSFRHEKTTEPNQIPIQKIQKRLELSAPLNIGMLLQAYQVPVISTSQPPWEAYALEVLAGWLDSGSDSILNQVLVKKLQLATEINIIYSPIARYETLFILELIPAKGASLIDLEQRVTQLIDQLKTQLMSQTNLKRIKNQIIATAIYEKDSLFTQAKIIGQAESVGINWRDDAKYVERIKGISAHQVQKVLQKYFIPKRRTSIIQPALKD